MKNPKVGEVVALYSGVDRYVSTIEKVDGDRLELRLRIDDSLYIRHRKSCHRIVKKPRKEWWMIVGQQGYYFGIYPTNRHALDAIGGFKGEIIHLREVKDNK